MMSMRPEIKDKTVKRLKRLGTFSPHTSIDWMVNFALDKLETKT